MKTVCCLLVALCFVETNAWTTPSPMFQCRTNADCNENQCCVLSPIVKKRQLIDPFYAHMCDDLKDEDSHFCMLRSKYSATAEHYTMSCPCKSGLRCQEPEPPMPLYGRGFGKCVKI